MPSNFLTLQKRNAYEKIHLKDETDILQCFFPTTDDKHFLHFFNGTVVTTKHRRTSLYIAIPKTDTIVNVKFIQALLGSKLLVWSFRLEKNEFDALFPKIRLEEFKKLPIRLTENEAPFIERVNQILVLKKEAPKADTSELEAEIDRMVYELYELTEEEILIVEGK